MGQASATSATPQEVGGPARPAVGGPCGRARASRLEGGGRPAQTLLLPFYGLRVRQPSLGHPPSAFHRGAWDRKRGERGARGRAGGQWERRVPGEEGEGRGS